MTRYIIAVIIIKIIIHKNCVAYKYVSHLLGLNMKKIGIFCLIFIFLLSVFHVSVFAQSVTDSNPESSDAATEVTEQAKSNAFFGIDSETTLLGNKRLVENIKTAIVYEVNSDTLMYSWNADDQMFPASFVKIITALVAIEKGNLEDVVTVSESAVASVPQGAVSADLIPGEEITLEDLLYCLLMGSANDAAVVIAEHIAGSEAAFVEMLNSYAAELGCKNSYFMNPHGLHNQQQYTTARDSARILAAAVKNENFYKIFTAYKHTIEETNKSPLRNLVTGNQMMDAASKLYYDGRVVGGRTGVTEDGRRCLATVAENNGMQLVTVVMGAESVYQEDGYSAISIGGYLETTALLDAGLSGYKTAQILYKGQALRQFDVENGSSNLVVGTDTSVTTVLPENVSINNLSFQYGDIHYTAPIEKGQKVSELEVWHQNMCVAKVDLFAMNTVSVRYADADESAADQEKTIPTAVIVLLVLLAVGATGYFGVRIYGRIRLMAANRRSRQYRRSRRRSR